MEHAHYNQIKSWTFCGSLSFKPSPAAFDLSRQSHEISCLRKAQGKFFVFKESKFLWEASKRVKIFLWNKKTLIARKGSFPIEERLPLKKREEFFNPGILAEKINLKVPRRGMYQPFHKILSVF